jgi:tape measure domain-containing protein
MATLGELNVLIGAEISDFEAKMATVQSGFGRLGDAAKQVGAGLTTYITVPLGLLGGAALAAYGKIDSLQRGINAITTQDLAKQGVTGLDAVQEAAALTGERIKELNDIAKAPGIGFEQAIQGDIRLRAVGISARDSAKDLKEFANAIATSGGSAADFDRVTVQLAQLSSKGKVLSQDLRPIIEAAPAVAQALQKLYGTIDSEEISTSLEKQGKSSSDFINTLTTELAKLPRVTAGFATQLENFEQGAVQNAGRLGDSLNKAFNFGGLLDKAGEAISKLVDVFTSLDPATQKLIFGIAGAAAAIGPLVFAFGAVTAAIPSVVAGLEVLGVASTAALGPIGIAAAAVAAAAYLIIDNWDDLVAYFTRGEGGAVFSDLASSVKDSVGVIAQAFASLNGGGNLSGLVTASGILKAIFRDIAVGITAISDVAGGSIGAVVKLLSGDLSGAAAEAQRALYGLIDPLANLLGFTKNKTVSFDAFFGLTAAVKAADEAALADAVSNNELTGSLQAAANAGKSLSGILQDLKDRLKAVQEQRDKETNEKAIFADDREIAAIEAEIKRLTQTAAGSQSALEKLREALRENGFASLALGDNFKYIDAQRSTLESGIKSLTDNGFAPGSKVVQAYVKQLRELPEAIEQAAGRALKGSEKLFDTPDFELKVPEIPQLPELLEPDYGSVFSRAAQGIIAGGGKLQDSLISVNDNATEQLAQFQLAAEMFSDSINDVLVNGFTNVAVSFGEAIGQIISGASGLEALPALVLGALGGMAIQVGELAIGVGIAVSGIKAALETLNPVVAIAAGIALVALGTAVKGVASNISKSGGSGGAGGAGASLASTSTGPLNSTATKAQELKITAEFVIRGRDLKTLADVESYRSLRTN